MGSSPSKQPPTDDKVKVKDPGDRLTLAKLPARAARFQRNFKKDERMRGACQDSEDFVKQLQAYYSKFVRKARTQMGDELAALDGAVEAFVGYVRIATNDGSSFPPHDQEDKSASRFLLSQLIVALNYTDTSERFGRALGRKGLIDLLVRLLQKFANQQTTLESFKGNQTKLSCILGILQNCAKLSSNLKYFKQASSVQTMAWYMENANTLGLKSKVKGTAVLVLSHIAGEEDNNIIQADDSIIKWLTSNVRKALAAKRNRSLGFTAVELVVGLAKLAGNDTNSDAIVECGLLESLLKMMEEGKPHEKLTAVNAVWALSFTTNNRKLFKEDVKLLEMLRTLSADEDAKMKASANGVLWVLQDQGNNGDLSNSHVMISYSWDNQKLVAQIKENLESNGFNVWMDVDRMGGSTLQAMADAVEQSAVVLVCMSQKYKDSPNCRTEGEYAYKLNKDVVPIKLEEDYSPDGWLGAIVGAKFYFDFTINEQFSPMVSKLVKELGERGRGFVGGQFGFSEEVVSPGYSAPLFGDAGDDLTSWSADDVKEWMESKQIKTNMMKDIDGKTLKFLASMKKEAPDYFYHYIEKQFRITKPQDLMKFIQAINEIS